MLTLSGGLAATLGGLYESAVQSCEDIVLCVSCHGQGSKEDDGGGGAVPPPREAPALHKTEPFAPAAFAHGSRRKGVGVRDSCFSTTTPRASSRVIPIWVMCSPELSGVLSLPGLEKLC